MGKNPYRACKELTFITWTPLCIVCRIWGWVEKKPVLSHWGGGLKKDPKGRGEEEGGSKHKGL